MKAFILLIYLLLYLSNIHVCNGQLQSYLINMQDSNYNYFDIKSNVQDYLDSLQLTMDSASFYIGGGEYKEFKFFERIWDYRLTPHGDFTVYYNEEKQLKELSEATFTNITNNSWYEIGPNRTQTVSGTEKGIGPVEFISFFDNGTIESTRYMLTGSTLGGLYYSTDYGESWSTGGTDKWHLPGCSWAVFHPSNHSIWYAASSGTAESAGTYYIGETGGIYRTINEGQEWIQIANSEDFGTIWTKIFKLLIDPINPNVLYAATSQGIFKTSNCGASDPSWINILEGFIFDLEFKPGSNSDLYCAAYIDINNDESWKILESNNSGNTWNALASQPTILNTTYNTREQYFTIEVSNAKEDYIYCATRDGYYFSLYYYDIAVPGSWQTIKENFGSYPGYGDGHGFGVDQNLNGETFLISKGLNIGKANIYSSNIDVYAPVHVDVEDIIYHPYNYNEVWACTHGGVEKSIDGGETWTAKYDGLGVAQIESFTDSYTDPKYVLAGIYHDGVQLTQSSYTPNWAPDWKWMSEIYRDGMQTLIDNTNPNHMWGSGQEGVWYYSDDAFSSPSTEITSGSTFFITTGVLNKQDPEVIYRNKFNGSGKEEVFRCNNRGMNGGIKEFVSNFQSLFPSNHKIKILRMYTHYNYSNYLVLFLYEEDPDKLRKYHIFRSTNIDDIASAVTWEELPTPRQGDDWISSIDFDPDDPNILYLAYGHSSDNNIATEIIFKIDYTNVSNPLYVDITKNLPRARTRFDCIETEFGSNGGLYFSNSYGVFYTNNDMLLNVGNEWALVGNNLPNNSRTGLEINYVSNTLRTSCFGRGMWELQLPCFTEEQPLIISENTSWNDYRRLDRSIEIEPGATLTFESNSRICMPTDSKITVKRGAKLIIDGGKITNACDALWRGIEVWGDPTQPHTNESAHGVAVIKSGAVIEYAEAAISTTRKDENGSLVYGYHGGIIKAYNSDFLNNKRAIEIWPYEFENRSYFHMCDFETSEALPDNTNFEYFIIMSDVNGVEILGCDFINSRPASEVYMDYRGYGIYSTESQYSLSLFELTEGNDKLNTFTKLNYGIKALGLTSSFAPDIKACTLKYNRTGIYLSGITSASVLSNYFLVESFDQDYDENIYCGLYLDNSTQYHVEDNFFEHDINTSQNENHTIGITVNNSGDQDNWIYRNIFKTLDIGILAQNQNRDDDGYHGLFVQCNDFGDNIPSDPSLHDNTYDIAVTKFGDCQYPGLKQSQGSNASTSSPAGNRFSQASNGIIDSDFSNPETLRLFYFQHNPTNEPRLNLTYHIPLHVTKIQTTHQWNESECCPPSFYPGGSGEIESAISSFQNDADSVNTLLTAMVDGGNTQELESDVILSTPDQSYDLYTDLTMKSPYLTDTVMVEAVRKENVLNEVMVRDILVANPQSAKSNEVMDELNSRINPLPDYMIADIEQGNDSLGDKEIMEASKYHYLHKRNICNNDLKRLYKTDTSGLTNRDTLIDFLVNSNSIQSKYELAFERFLDKDYSNTSAVLLNISSQFVLSQEDNDLYQRYSDYFDIIINLKQNNNQYYDIDSLQIDILDSLSYDIYSFPGAYARNILLYNDAISYNEPYILPDSTLKAEEYERSSSTSLQDYPEFKIYPNPAANYVTIEYNLKSQSYNGYIEFINLQGKMILHEELHSGKHSKIISMNDDFSSGTYLCKLVCNGKVLDTEKLTIIR